ncbi:hypothetical protein RNO48_26060, partial [Escherichia coli]|nr:hypothetical protein [Escherichia coli]
EWVHVQLHQQKGMISLSPPTICNSAQQDALLVVDRQMSYMRQQLSARMLSRYQNNYHFGGSTL